MAVLYVGKMRIATRMQSHSLRAEAMESLFCDLQDFAILVGLGLNSLFSWWWADPVAALVLVPFFLKEGRENFAGHEDQGDDRFLKYQGTPGLLLCKLLLRPALLPVSNAAKHEYTLEGGFCSGRFGRPFPAGMDRQGE